MSLFHNIYHRAFSNLRINVVLSDYEFNAMDKALSTEIVYGTVNRKYTLDFYLKPFVKTKIKAWVRQLLWMSIYQYV
ncbi:transcription antitermination factor NusB, partial [Staphylococcus aureus]|uniref:transcription antitermination factor NusB n=1 Tax=Staphylococcus aureus TaxID=1280 RepID=UPI0027303224